MQPRVGANTIIYPWSKTAREGIKIVRLKSVEEAPNSDSRQQGCWRSAGDARSLIARMTQVRACCAGQVEAGRAYGITNCRCFV